MLSQEERQNKNREGACDKAEERDPDGGNHSDNDLKTGWRREYNVRLTWLRKPDFPRCHRPYLGFWTSSWVEATQKYYSKRGSWSILWNKGSINSKCSKKSYIKAYPYSPPVSPSLLVLVTLREAVLGIPFEVVVCKEAWFAVKVHARRDPNCCRRQSPTPGVWWDCLKKGAFCIIKYPGYSLKIQKHFQKFFLYYYTELYNLVNLRQANDLTVPTYINNDQSKAALGFLTGIHSGSYCHLHTYFLP